MIELGFEARDHLDGIGPFQVDGFRQDDVGIPGDFTEIDVNGDDQVQFIQGLAGGGGVRDGLQRLEAVDDQGLDGIGVFIQNGVGQHLGIAVGGVGNGKLGPSRSRRSGAP